MTEVFYRPQRSCGQGNIFAPVCHSVHGGGGCLPQCMLGYHTPWEHTPPPGADPPWNRHPPEQTPPWGRHPPGGDTPPEQTPPRADPPREADSGIRSMSGRYAPYWNAFLFLRIVAQYLLLSSLQRRAMLYANRMS